MKPIVLIDSGKAQKRREPDPAAIEYWENHHLYMQIKKLTKMVLLFLVLNWSVLNIIFYKYWFFVIAVKMCNHHFYTF